jgi:uncharacterized protein (TIGR02300 family)
VADTVADIRGLKRICMNCGNRFYDMNKRPVACPSCATEFSGEIKVKARRGRVAALDDDEGQVSKATASKAAKGLDDDDDDDIVELEEDTVSLDDLDDDNVDDDDIDPDLDIDDDLGNLDDLEDDLDEDVEDLEDIVDEDDE